MKKTIFTLIVSVTFFTNSVFATGGTCSWHGGVDCSKGASIYGNPTCNDGWANSTEKFSDLQICKKTVNSCSSSEWTTIKNKYNIDQLKAESAQRDSEILQLSYDRALIPNQVRQSFAGTGATDSGVQPAIDAKLRENQLKMDALQSSLNVFDDNFDAIFKRAYSECADLAESNKLNSQVQQITNYFNYTPVIQTQDLCATLPNTHKDNSGLCVCNDGYTKNTTTFQCEKVLTTSTNKFTFVSLLSVGSSGNEVLELQKILNKLGLLTATPNGYFGNMTKKALQLFQKNNKISQTGMTGPQTRSALNK